MITLKIIDNDGKERTVENVLDYSCWTKDDIEMYADKKLSDIEMNVISEKLSAKLRDLEEFADTYMFQDCLNETLYELIKKREEKNE